MPTENPSPSPNPSPSLASACKQTMAWVGTWGLICVTLPIVATTVALWLPVGLLLETLPARLKPYPETVTLLQLGLLCLVSLGMVGMAVFVAVNFPSWV